MDSEFDFRALTGIITASSVFVNFGSCDFMLIIPTLEFLLNMAD